MMPQQPYRIFIGWDPSQMEAWNVAQASCRGLTTAALDIRRLSMEHLRVNGLYTRPTRETAHGYWDAISEAPMSTGHAIARFFVPFLCSYQGWALFTDGDVLVRRDLADLFALADPAVAVQVVQHAPQHPGAVKMTGEQQTTYARKNWSSVMLFNCAHPAHATLTPELVNTVPGRDLHRFCWLRDAEIGALPADWNHLVGSPPNHAAALVHFTEGLPYMPGYEAVEFADEWRARAEACGYRRRTA